MILFLCFYSKSFYRFFELSLLPSCVSCLVSKIRRNKHVKMVGRYSFLFEHFSSQPTKYPNYACSRVGRVGPMFANVRPPKKKLPTLANKKWPTTLAFQVNFFSVVREKKNCQQIYWLEKFLCWPNFFTD